MRAVYRGGDKEGDRQMAAGGKVYIVHPDDPDIPEKAFRTIWDAQSWAATLCSSYWIEEAEA